MTAPILIRRTGAPALRLEGYELLAQAHSFREGKGSLSTRWHDLALYARPEAQDVCVCISYRTTRLGELGHEQAELMPRSEVAQALQDYDPTELVQGYPEGAQFAARQERLLADIEHGYDQAVSDLLERAGITEAT